MRKAVFITLLITISLYSVEVFGADWKFTGFAKLFKNEETIVFYDSESVERVSGGTTRVWIEAIALAKFTEMMKTNVQQIMEQSTKKNLIAYKPPYSLIDSKAGVYDSSDIITWEALANYSEIKPRAKFLFEINCLGKKIRTFSTTSYKNDGEMEANINIPDEWNDISLESNGETLQKILCRKQQ